MKNLSEELISFLIGRGSSIAGSVMGEIKDRIEKRKFWPEKKGCICTTVHEACAVLGQSRQLRDLGGQIRYQYNNNKIAWTEWLLPPDARAYEIASAKRGRVWVDYFLVYFNDGREFFIRRGKKKIKAIKKLPDDVLRQLVFDFCLELKSRLARRIEKKRL